MLELEEQLRRYGDALEEHLAGMERAPVAPPLRRRPRSLRWRAAAAVLVVAGLVGALVLAWPEERESVTASGPETPSRAGVFSFPTGTVLLFSDGLDGVTAIDLDRRLVGRRVVEGERAGDQPVRLTLVGDDLVVGWGEIYVAPLAGGSSSLVADATIHLPATEPGEIWTFSTHPSGQVEPGSPTVQRIRTDGTVTFSSDAFDRGDGHPMLGVPGGLAVNTAGGVAVWDADREAVGPVLGPGPAASIATNGRQLAWCLEQCAAVHVVVLQETGEPVPAHIAFAPRIAFSPDGRQLAYLRSTEAGSELVLRDVATGAEEVVAGGISGDAGALQWSDGGRLFYTEGIPAESTTRIGVWDPDVERWELATIPVAAGGAAIPLDRARAASFFSDVIGDPAGCPPPEAFPSGRSGVCTFAFPSPDAPEECVAGGEAMISVPDVIGLSLHDATTTAQQAGLNVVGAGVPEGDPTEPSAIVRAQEPPPGVGVPLGTCIGFRTAEDAG